MDPVMDPSAETTSADTPPADLTSARGVADGPDGLAALVGRQFGPSGWHEITQQRVNEFAAATGDHQWIHVDPERAASSPFGGPIAHGYLTLSLTPVVLGEIFDVHGFSLVVNYGCDRVRFPSPVPVGSRVRASVVVDEVRPIDGGVQVQLTMTFETDRSDGASGAGEGAKPAKPACVASIVSRYYS